MTTRTIMAENIIEINAILSLFDIKYFSMQNFIILIVAFFIVMLSAMHAKFIILSDVATFFIEYSNFQGHV